MAPSDPGDDIVLPVPPRGIAPHSPLTLTGGFDPDSTLSRPTVLKRPLIRIPLVLTLSALGALVCSIVAVDHSGRSGYLLQVKPRPVPETLRQLPALTEAASPAVIPLGVSLAKVLAENEQFYRLPEFLAAAPDLGPIRYVVTTPGVRLASPHGRRSAATSRHFFRGREKTILRRIVRAGYDHAAERGARLAFLQRADVAWSREHVR